MKNSAQKIVAISALFIALCFISCKKECGDSGYFAHFFITDKKTGKPYFNVHNDNPDSLRVFINRLSNSPIHIDKNYNNENGYVFGAIDIYDQLKDTLYIYLNNLDTDTLIISNKLIRINGKCKERFYLTIATFNNYILQSIASDTTGGIVYFNLIK